MSLFVLDTIARVAQLKALWLNIRLTDLHIPRSPWRIKLLL
jgi:hypothetical protein